MAEETANLSVIVPTFNSGKTISNCLSSLIDQSFRPAEILIIDNASTDDTEVKVKQLTPLHPFIKWFSESDNGIYSAMNKGIKMAKSDWVYFMGSDDRLYDKNVIKAVFFNSDTNYDVIYGDVLSEAVSGLYGGEFNMKDIFNRNIPHQAIFLRRSLFRLTGLFDTRFKAHADWDHNLKWLRDDRVRKLHINKTIAHFAGGGLSSSHKDKLFEQKMIWERTKHNKREISRLNRLRMIKSALNNAAAYGAARFFFSIIADAPLFML